MQIREKIIAAFNDDARRRFPARIAGFLWQEDPTEAARYSGRELVRFISESFQKAQEYGMTTRESALGVFSALRLIVGPDFDQHPPSRPVAP